MYTTNYCAECEQHAREIARLTAELANSQEQRRRATQEAQLCRDAELSAINGEKIAKSQVRSMLHAALDAQEE